MKSASEPSHLYTYEPLFQKSWIRPLDIRAPFKPSPPSYKAVMMAVKLLHASINALRIPRTRRLDRCGLYVGYKPNRPQRAIHCNRCIFTPKFGTSFRSLAVISVIAVLTPYTKTCALNKPMFAHSGDHFPLSSDITCIMKLHHLLISCKSYSFAPSLS